MKTSKRRYTASLRSFTRGTWFAAITNRANGRNTPGCSNLRSPITGSPLTKALKRASFKALLALTSVETLTSLSRSSPTRNLSERSSRLTAAVFPYPTKAQSTLMSVLLPVPGAPRRIRATSRWVVGMRQYPNHSWSVERISGSGTTASR
ncbi:hypothetical protein D3C86_1276980 [compost metagenome]